MSTYIGAIKMQLDPYDTLIGSTLYGVCSSNTGAVTKNVTLPNFDRLYPGITVQVRFVNGNSVHTGVNLLVGSTSALPIVGSCLCDENQVISFTYVRESNTDYWYSHHNIKGAMPITGGTFTGPVTLNGVPTADLQAATKGYVDSKVSGFDGLTGAMHFIGISSTAITNGGTENPTIENTVNTLREKGDVVLYLQQEYVWNGSTWQLLGDEGSYVLKTSQTTTNVISNINLAGGSAPTLGTPITANDLLEWNAGSTSGATVSNGILQLTNNTIPTLQYKNTSIPNVTDIGSMPTLTTTPATVIAPVASP